MSETRPLYWSVQRELWENVALHRPAGVAAVAVFAFSLSSIVVSGKNRCGSIQRHLSAVRNGGGSADAHGYRVECVYVSTRCTASAATAASVLEVVPSIDVTAVLAKASHSACRAPSSSCDHRRMH